MNPENVRDCQCCWMESDECQIFRPMNEWLCTDCYEHTEKMYNKLTNNFVKEE